MFLRSDASPARSVPGRRNIATWERALNRDQFEVAAAIENAVERVAADVVLQAELDAAIEELRTGRRTEAVSDHP